MLPPAENPHDQSIPGLTPDLTGQSGTEIDTPESSHYLWSYTEIFIDPATLEFEIIPARSISGHWNVLRWLESGPCFDCFKLVGIQPTGNGTINAEIEVRHPFALTNLTGFDVRGIAMFNASHIFIESGLTASDRYSGDGQVVNPDGFTTLYNWTTEGLGPDGLQGYIKGNLATAVFPDATLNAYKCFNTDNPSNTRNAFYSGDTITVTYEVDMPETGFVFGYAVDASWAPPTTKPVVDPMTQFPPEANCAEPWKIETSQSPIGQGLTDEGGSTILSVDVYDHQGKDSHNLPIIECSDIFPGTLEAVWSFDGDGFSTFTVTVENTSLAPIGEYLALVSVEDKDNASSPDWIDLTAYNIITLEVVDYVFLNELPIAAAIAEPTIQQVCELIYFHDDGSYDPDGGAIQLYEWDWDNDGTFDETGAYLYHSWSEPGIYQVQYRVTDNEDTSDTLDVPLEITIENALPTAIAEADSLYGIVGTEINFDASASHDNDCSNESITLYEWDFDFDGSFNPGDTGISVSHSWPEAGTHQVQLRVTDNEGTTDLLDSPLSIQIAADYMDPLAFATADPSTQTVCEPVQFSDDGSYDPDGGLIVLYEWDWDNDGIYDESGAELQHTWDTVGTFYVQFRVTDDDSATATLDAPLEIIIQNALPTASAIPSKYSAKPDELIDFNATASHDNDCSGESIVLYEWDWDFDGTFTSDDTGANESHSWSSVGTYQVQLRVTDDEGDTDLLDSPFSISINNQAPEISITNCPSLDVNLNTYTFMWTASDDSDDPSAMQYEVSLDGAWQGWQTGISSYQWNSIPSGPHVFTVRVRDNGIPQLTDDAVCNFDVNLAPSISINNCPSQDVNSTSFTFTWDVSDDLDPPSALSYNMSRDGVWTGWQTGIPNYTWNSITSGPHIFKVKVRDTGNPQLVSPESICNFTRNSRPSVSIDNCPGSTIIVDTYTFNWTGSDDLSAESAMDYSWKLDLEAWSSWQTGLLSIDLINLADSTHEFFVRVRDTGNPQLTCEAAPYACDSCTFTVDTSITYPPPDVTGFSASDGLGSLNVREVQLSWDAVAGKVDFYDIERGEWTEATGWQWVALHTALGTETSWLDMDARYSGTGNPIEYRIKARNSAGSSPGWATDTGYPRLREIRIALWCAADDASGTNPVTTWSRAMADLNDSNEFWNKYGIDFVLKNPSGFLWVSNPAFRQLTGSEPDQMHQAFGHVQSPDSLTCYYVESCYGSFSYAFAKSFCPGSSNNLPNIYIVMSRDSRGVDPDVNHACLAHETGHAVARLIDIYLLDTNWNLIYDDPTTCDDIQDFCITYPTLWPPLFCDENAFYPEEPNSFYKIPKQIMFYSFSGRPISDYDMYVSQWFWFDEWLSTYESNYPEP